MDIRYISRNSPLCCLSPVNKKNSRRVNNNACVYARCIKFFKQSRSCESFKVRNVLILDYRITTMFANTQWSVSGIKIHFRKQTSGDV